MVWLFPTLPCRSLRCLWSSLLLVQALASCSLLTDPLPRHVGRSLDSAGDLGLFAGCRPILSGELLVNELLVRPGGVDLDGDGQSTSRDEAVELRVDAPEPVHLRGVSMQVGDQHRGTWPLDDCLQPGAMLVVVGHTTGAVALPEGASLVSWPQTLKLPDGPATLRWVGSQGAVLAEASWPDQGSGPGASMVRQRDGVWWTTLVRHDSVMPERRHSLGACASGEPPGACWPPTDETR